MVNSVEEKDKSNVGSKPKAGLRVLGHVDGLLGEDFVVGWASDLLGRGAPVPVCLRQDDRTLVSGLANQERIDVKDAGIGGSYCGFSLPIPEDLFDGSEHSIDVFAEIPGAPTFLIGTLRPKLPYRAKTLSARNGSVGHERPRFVRKEIDERQMALKQVSSVSLEEALAGALLRIEELDHTNRLLSSERDELRSRLDALSQRFSRDLSSIGAVPRHALAAHADEIVRTFDVTQRRDLWLTQLSNLGAEGAIFATFPHNGDSGKLSLLVWGSGGIGDMLYLSTVVRELFLLFRDCNIFVLNENRFVHDVFSTNPYVTGTIWLEKKALYDFIQVAHSLDVFDLIAEVKYAVTYTRPPLSRISQDFFRTANTRAGEWQRYVRYRWPHLNNLFANAVVSQGLNKLDLVGLTSLLPIDRYSDVDLFFGYTELPFANVLNGVAYVTVHHGSDKKMAAQGGVQTKNLPDGTWPEVVSHLQIAGYKVIQLGERHEQKIDGVDLDLRGETSLRETAQVIKYARAHLDTEGGLVHLARAVHTRSVVAFGPTPVKFFGYPQNENLAPPVCGNCWWTTDRWAIQCPRGLAAPECMSAHSAAILLDRGIKLAQEHRSVEITKVSALYAPEGAGLVEQVLASVATERGEGALLIGPEHDVGMILSTDAFAGRIVNLVPAECLQNYQDQFGDGRFLLPYSSGNVPRNSRSFDWAVVVGTDPALAGFIPICLDVARCLRSDGTLLLLILSDYYQSVANFLAAGPQSCAVRMLGNKAVLRWPERIAADFVRHRDAAAVVLEIRLATDEFNASHFGTEASEVGALQSRTPSPTSVVADAQLTN